MNRAAVHRRATAWLLLCPLGQACSPLVYELAVERETDDHGPHGDTDPTGPDPTGPDPTETPGETTPPPACDDGIHNGGETDLDCGGPCGPCGPGQTCEEPQDCDVGGCVASICQKPACHTAIDCPTTGDPCLQPTCTPDGQCLVASREGESCDLGDPCTLEAVCKAGTCAAISVRDCSELDGPCRAGVCTQKGICAVEWHSEGEPCDDGLACTFLEHCSAGECVGKQASGPLFFSDFNGDDGWTADPPWQIGPAKPSLCGLGGADDPADDHSPGPDDNLAGAALGDCLPVDAFSDVCLESPTIEVMFMPGDLWLSYWSVLNTAGTPMTSRVEIFDGEDKKWLLLESVDSFTAEPTWTEHTLDLSAFKAPFIKIRFCHSADGMSDLVGGWSIDDLRIGPPECM